MKFSEVLLDKNDIIQKVTNYYKSILGRMPDKQGLEYFVKEIQSGKINWDDMSTIFYNSDEYKNKPSRYVGSWNVKTIDEAKKAIYSIGDSSDFIRSGKLDAEFISLYVKKNFEVLEYGCGIGRVAKFLSEKVLLLHALDISKEMLMFANEYCKNCPNIQFSLTNGFSISLKDSSIDFAYTMYVLQHVDREDAILILKEIHRVLKNNGKIYFTVPDLAEQSNWKTLEESAIDFSQRVPHRMRMYAMQEVEILMDRLGYRIVDIPSNRTKVKEQNIRIVAEKINI